MTLSLKNRYCVWNLAKLTPILIVIFMSMMTLTLLQDFLESKRSGHQFYFSEALLFNFFWMLFIPIIGLLQGVLNKIEQKTIKLVCLLTTLATVVHLLIFPLFASLISYFFYHSHYSYYKFLSYTCTHDLFKLIMVYSGYLLWIKFQSVEKESEVSSLQVHLNMQFLINNGKEKILIKQDEIFHITSASPYVSIQLEDKNYLHSDTLKSLLEKLNSDQFIRIHKSSVINITKVISLKSRLNGDYDIFLSNGECLRLSRTYAADFKKSFQPSHRFNY